MNMTRRRLALAALASATVAHGASAADATSEPASDMALPPGETGYGGALAKFEGQYQPPEFDSLSYSLVRYNQAPRTLRFQAKSAAEAAAWQKKLRRRVESSLGGFPAVHGDLKARSFEVKQLPTHTREALAFASRDGSFVFGYLLIPKGAKTPAPVVICLPGHGRGVDDIVGIDASGNDRTVKVGYAYDYALQVVEHGMAALAIEMIGFGCRRDAAARKAGQGQSSCQPSAGAALLLGETMAGWRTWDVMRACDFIATRKELDSSRIGCMGISGGGLITLYAAAMEPRIRAAFMSCSLCTFRDSIVSLSHCIDNYVPGMLNWAEMSDIAGLIAPRPFFVESGEKDPIFPLAGSREAFESVRRVYQVLGNGDLCQREEFPGEHEFHGRGGLEFLRKHLA
jgi:dienelactone hydrolase